MALCRVDKNCKLVSLLRVIIVFRHENGIERNVAVLIGKTVTHIDIAEDEMQITCDDGSKYLFYHEQDCCERVSIVGVDGDPLELVGYELLVVDEAKGDDEPDSTICDDSWTATKFTFKTTKDTVVVRWIGQSNGYYSESVDFIEIFDAKTSEK